MTAKLSRSQKAILDVLRKHPDITSQELKSYLPDLSSSCVHTALSNLKSIGWVKVTGQTQVKAGKKPFLSCATYAAKYTRRTEAKAPPAPEIKHETITTVIPRVDAKLQCAYEHLAMLHTETMAELAEEKKKAHLCGSWWCRMKRWFV